MNERLNARDWNECKIVGSAVCLLGGPVDFAVRCLLCTGTFLFEGVHRQNAHAHQPR